MRVRSEYFYSDSKTLRMLQIMSEVSGVALPASAMEKLAELDAVPRQEVLEAAA